MTTEELNNLPGHISLENIFTLQKYLGKGLIIDVGTCMGKSAICIEDTGAEVLTCDPLFNASESQLEELNERLKGKRIKFFRETSEEFGLKHCPIIDGCFIDGVHNYIGVKSDIEGIVTKVRPGGYVLFHDANLYSNTIPVAIKEFEGILYEFVEEAGGRLDDPKEGSIWVGKRI